MLVDALGVPVRPEAYSDKFHKLTRAAGLRETNPHLVRHTLAVAMDRAGIALVDAAPLLATQLRPTSRPICGHRRWEPGPLPAGSERLSLG